KHPRELRNLEEAATAYISWWNHTAPGAYDAFCKRIRGQDRRFRTERTQVMTNTNTLANVLVNTDWVAQHATDTGVRVVEVDVDTSSFDQGHVPGAAGWNWTTELCDTVVRDIVPAKKLEELLGKTGIDNKTTVVLYGD